MRILFLGKRHNMDIDSVVERHGRAYHLPWELSRLGHDVSGLYVDYRTREGRWQQCEGRFHISVCSLGGKRLPRFLTYCRELRRLIRQTRPEVIIAGSDALNVVIGRAVASHQAIPFVADIKDDYSAFRMTANIPFLERAFYRAVKQADLVTCVSPHLEGKLRSKGIPKTIVLENSVPATFASDVARPEARRKLRLPQECFLFGTAGALRASRDIATFMEGARRFLLMHDSAALVLAGPRDDEFKIPNDISDRTHDLGKLPPEDIPLLFRALDLGIIPNRPGVFGNHCYPQKYKEMLACGLAVAACSVGVFSLGAPTAPEPVFYFFPDDPHSLSDCLVAAFEQAGDLSAPSFQVDSWQDQAKKLEVVLGEICWQTDASLL